MRNRYQTFLATFVALLAIAVGPAPAHAQCGPWQIIDSPNPGATFNNIFGMKALAAEDIWSVGHHKNNGVNAGYRTLAIHWDGLDWIEVPSPNPGAADHALESVDGAAFDDVWAVGFSDDGDENARQPLALHWNGGEWSVVPTPRPHRYSGVAGVTALAPNDVWAVGYQGKWGVDFEGEQPMSMHWDGAEWTVVPTPTFAQRYINHLRGVAALAPNDVWAVGQTGWPTPDLTLILHYDGTAWTQVDSPSPGSSQSVLEGMVAVAADDIWAVGFQYVERLGRRTLVEHWDGQSWTVVPSPNHQSGWSYMLSVAAGAPNDVWAAGFNNRGGPWYPLAFHWDGSTWRMVELPESGISAIARAVAVLPSGESWVGGEVILQGGWQRTLIERLLCTSP
jgi:hypothetical protein